MAKDLTKAVVRVGQGRGFVVEHDHKRVVITASHCLPVDSDGRLILPPSHLGRYVHENTYSKLLGPLGGEPTVWVECCFVDPVSDIAVLGGPDDQALSEEADAYEEFVGSAVRLKIVDAPEMSQERIPVRMIKGHRIGGQKVASPGCWGFLCLGRPLARAITARAVGRERTRPEPLAQLSTPSTIRRSRSAALPRTANAAW